MRGARVFVEDELLLLDDVEVEQLDEEEEAEKDAGCEGLFMPRVAP